MNARVIEDEESESSPTNGRRDGLKSLLSEAIYRGGRAAHVSVSRSDSLAGMEEGKATRWGRA